MKGFAAILLALGLAVAPALLAGQEEQEPPESLPVIQQPARPPRSAAVEELPPPYEAIFEKVVAAIEASCAPEQRPEGWDQSIAQARSRLAGVVQDRDFYELLDPVLSSFAPPRPELWMPEQRRYRPGIAVSSTGAAAQIVQVDPASQAWRLGVRAGDALMTPVADLKGDAGTAAEVRLHTRGGLNRQLKIQRDRREEQPWPPELHRTEAGTLLLRPAEGGPGPLRALLDTVPSAGTLEIDLRDTRGDLAGLRTLAGGLGLGSKHAIEVQTWPLGNSPMSSDETVSPWPAADDQSGPDEESELMAALTKQSHLRVQPEPVSEPFRGKVRVLVDGHTRGPAEAWALAFRKAGFKLHGSPTYGRAVLDRTKTVEGGWSLRLPVALLGPLKPVEPDAATPPQR